MGEVYRAHDSRLWRDVALKVLPDAVRLEPGRLARFEQEARALAALNHPGIAAIYGVEEGPAERGHQVLEASCSSLSRAARWPDWRGIVLCEPGRRVDGVQVETASRIWQAGTMSKLIDLQGLSGTGGRSGVYDIARDGRIVIIKSSTPTH